MKQQGNLIVISGPSAAGKGTICKEVLATYPDLAYSISATTRAPRQGEEHGINYWFTSKEDFQRMIAEEKLLEWAEVYGNYYGTPSERVREMLAAGRDVVLEIDTQGAMLVKEKFPEGVFVYIVPPSLKELERRIYKRGTDSGDSIQRRLKAAVDEIRQAYRYDYIVVNDIVNEAVKKIAAIVEAERCVVSRREALIKLIIEEGNADD